MASTLVLHPQGSPRRSGQGAPALLEFLVGCVCLGGAALAGFVFVHRPWPNRVDAIGLRLLPADLSSRWATDLTRFGSTAVVVAGVVVLAVIAVLSRDRRRAVACVIAPLVAVTVVELVAKPLVGRHFEGSSALSYPSGTVTAVAALAAGAFLVSPLVLKPTAALLGGVFVMAVCVAVVILRWH
jgi:membrane-associated phospholipid phosphatase